MAVMKPNTVIRSKTRHHRLRSVLSLTVIVLTALFSWWYLFLRTEVETDDAYVSGNIVPIRALVPGIVSRIGVDDSMPVRAGQWLLDEERNVSKTRLDKAGADLAEAVRRTKSLFAQVAGQEAEVAALSASRKKLVADIDRYMKAEPSGAVSSQQVSDTQAEIAVMSDKIAAGKALLKKASAFVSGTSVESNPQVLQARAEYVASYIAYHRASLFSPVNGYAADRRVQAGEMVKAGQYLMSVVPLDELWVTANLKETKIARVRTGEEVEIRAHAYGSDAVFHGKVIGMDPSGGSTFSLFPPNNATGNYIHIVERVPVRISLSKSELQRHPLRPGMSVTVSIETRNYPSLRSLATDINTNGKSYSTGLYDNEMKEAQSSAQQIIREN